MRPAGSRGRCAIAPTTSAVAAAAGEASGSPGGLAISGKTGSVETHFRDGGEVPGQEPNQRFPDSCIVVGHQTAQGAHHFAHFSPHIRRQDILDSAKRLFPHASVGVPKPQEYLIQRQSTRSRRLSSISDRPGDGALAGKSDSWVSDTDVVPTKDTYISP